MKRSTEEYQRKAAWISAALLRWFRTAARPMAWRETRDPYRIWVSEIMLQQTRVETVAPYYDRFLLKFPDVGSLAAAPIDDVLKAWEGLGYYSRARNLHRAAGILVARHGAKVPRTVEELEALPGSVDRRPERSPRSPSGRTSRSSMRTPAASSPVFSPSKGIPVPPRSRTSFGNGPRASCGRERVGTRPSR